MGSLMMKTGRIPGPLPPPGWFRRGKNRAEPEVKARLERSNVLTLYP